MSARARREKFKNSAREVQEGNLERKKKRKEGKEKKGM